MVAEEGVKRNASLVITRWSFRSGERLELFSWPSKGKSFPPPVLEYLLRGGMYLDRHILDEALRRVNE
jgi:hypothetical protein